MVVAFARIGMGHYQKLFKVYNQESKQYEEFLLADLLTMINEDRSKDWSYYDEGSSIQQLIEAINEFCHPYQF